MKKQLLMIVVLLLAGVAQAEIPVSTGRSTMLYAIKAATVTKGFADVALPQEAISDLA